MGLLTIIRKNKRKAREVRVLILGLDNAGKTTIVKRLLGEDVEEVSPTLGFSIRTIVHRGFTLNVWDIGGQSSLRPYWRNYFEVTDAVIWVVDSSDRERMSDCRAELKGLLKEERLASASLLVFANKQDITDSLTASEISDALDLPSLASHTCQIHPCAARGEGEDRRLWEGLDWVCAEVGRRVYYSDGGQALHDAIAKEKAQRQTGEDVDRAPSAA